MTTAKITRDAPHSSDWVATLDAYQRADSTPVSGYLIEQDFREPAVVQSGRMSRGSGGPLFNREGKVIGVNRAMLSGFGGSNMAVPIRYADELVK